MKFIYRVESDVPLAIFSGVGNTPVVRPTEHGYNTVTERGKPQTVRNGPQGIPSTLTLELCGVRADIMDMTQEQYAALRPRAERLLAHIEGDDSV